ncbi:MAG: hypothetical protein ACXVY6_04155 [Gaiellaceae bacterium]
MNEAQQHELELDAGVVGFAVVGRDEEPIGEVMRVSLDGVCLLVASHKGLLGRNKEHAVHSSVITGIDPDTQTITVARTREQVEHAPAYSNLDQSSSEKLASYYA